jgi:hypothetical protein
VCLKKGADGCCQHSARAGTGCPSPQDPCRKQGKHRLNCSVEIALFSGLLLHVAAVFQQPVN